MLQVNCFVAYTIHPESNKVATGVKIKVTSELKLSDNPTLHIVNFPYESFQLAAVHSKSSSPYIGLVHDR